jgi:hypothetical protein
MARTRKASISEQTMVLVEFQDDVDDEYRDVSAMKDIAERSAEALNKAMNTIRSLAQQVAATVDQMTDTPSQVEVEFGIVFKGENDVFIAKTGVECSISVKLIWESKPQKL